MFQSGTATCPSVFPSQFAARHAGWDTNQDYLPSARPLNGTQNIAMILGFARRLKDIRAVVQTMRDQGINVIGPFRKHNGTLLYFLFDCIATEHELLDLARAGKLDAAGVSELTAKAKKSA